MAAPHYPPTKKHVNSYFGVYTLSSNKKTTPHYVNNKQLYEEMKKFRQSVQDARDQGLERPRVPEYIGECLILIARNLAKKINFAGYSFKADMISDGIENCINYIDNFDPEKSNNPFAYSTQIIYYAFLRRIQKEKRQAYIKHKNMINTLTFDYVDIDSDHSSHQKLDPKNMDKTYDIIQSYEEGLVKSKKKAALAAEE